MCRPPHDFSGIPMILKTKRLFLRPIAVSDAPALFEARGDAEVMRFWDWPEQRDVAAVERIPRRAHPRTDQRDHQMVGRGAVAGRTRHRRMRPFGDRCPSPLRGGGVPVRPGRIGAKGYAHEAMEAGDRLRLRRDGSPATLGALPRGQRRPRSGCWRSSASTMKAGCANTSCVTASVAIAWIYGLLRD